MPVILERDAWPVLLGEDQGGAAAMMYPPGDSVLRRGSVGPDVSSPRQI